MKMMQQPAESLPHVVCEILGPNMVIIRRSGDCIGYVAQLNHAEQPWMVLFPEKKVGCQVLTMNDLAIIQDNCNQAGFKY